MYSCKEHGWSSINYACPICHASYTSAATDFFTKPVASPTKPAMQGIGAKEFLKGKGISEFSTVGQTIRYINDEWEQGSEQPVLVTKLLEEYRSLPAPIQP